MLLANLAELTSINVVESLINTHCTLVLLIVQEPINASLQTSHHCFSCVWDVG